MLTVVDKAGINNAIDDDVEEFMVEGKFAQKLIQTIKAAKLERAASIPLSIVFLFICPAVSAGLMGARVLWKKLTLYDYEIIDSQKVKFTMRPEEVEKLHTKQEKKAKK